MFRGKFGRPEKLTLEYIRSKEAEEDRNKTKEWELLQNPKMNLNRAQRALMGVEDELENKREEMKTIREKLNAQWNDLAKNEDRLRDSFVKFNNFVKENAGKSKRARDKMDDAERHFDQLVRKMDVMELEHKNNKEFKVLLDEAIKEYHMYEDYLKPLCNHETGYKSPDDIIAKFEILMAARVELMKRQEESMLRLEQARADMQRLIEWGTNGLVGHYTRLADLGKRHENAALKTRTWERVVWSIREASINKFRLIEVTRGSIWNTYRAICYRKGVAHGCKKADVEGQLFFIKRVLSEFKTVQRLVRKKLAGRKLRKIESFKGDKSTATLSSAKGSEMSTNK